MSIQYNDLTNFKGLIQLIEEECGFNQGDISGNAALLKKFTASINLTLDDYIELAIKSSGSWQFDDSGHGDYPIIKTNLVASQRDYSFTTDENGSLVLDIYRVFARDSITDPYREIYPVDAQSDREEVSSGLTDGLNTEGKPYRYDKTANGIFLDPVPDTSVTDGLKVYINREASYFTTADTTKKPGVPGIHHEYFVLKPALRYARRKGLANLNDLEKAVIDFEGSERLGITGKIQDYFSGRERDVSDVLQGEPIIYE